MSVKNLRKRATLTVAVAAALGVSLPAVAQMQSSNPGGPVGDLDAPAGSAVVLYDQTDNASGNGAPDQDFEVAYDAYDSEGADDFVVPGGETWNITEVSIVGTSSGGNADSVSIRFLEDNAGSPGAEVAGCVFTGLSPVQAAGSFTTTLPSACVLPEGTYWMAHQTAQNFGVAGQHFWSNRTVQTGNAGHWQNPNGGFGNGCTSWTPQTTCGVGGGTNPDFLFSLAGTIGAPDQARFLVTKDFNDNNEAEVEVTLSCNTGLPLEQTIGVSEGNPVNFVIGDFAQGELDCEVTEEVPVGYEASYDNGDTESDVSCSWVDLIGGQYACTIDNDLLPSEVTVTKEWIDENPGFDAQNIAEAYWSCSNAAFCIGVAGGPGGCSGYLDFYGNPDDDSFEVFPDWESGTTCNIVETTVFDGGVEIDDSDCQGIELFPGDSAECTIVNTRLYEGIPTLSQYGLGLLALMMLGMGFVAVRRFV